VIHQCDVCQRWLDDEVQWTVCPHGPLWAVPENYCLTHDVAWYGQGKCRVCEVETAAKGVADGEVYRGSAGRLD
jgi:hypothetical protein